MRVLALTLLFVPILSAQDKVSLKRTICFGSCPVYTLEISSDGSVIYDGEISVLVHGRHTATVSKDAAQELIRGFERLKFFEMKDVYKTNISDGPSEVLTLTLGGRTKSIRDEGTGPRELYDLATRVDVLAGVERWTRGNQETVPSLRRERFDFKSVAAGAMLARVAKRGSVDVVRDLIDAGVPLNEKWNADGARDGISMNTVPLDGALENKDPEVLLTLIRAGASKDDPEVRESVRRRALEKGWNEAAELLR